MKISSFAFVVVLTILLSACSGGESSSSSTQDSQAHGSSPGEPNPGKTNDPTPNPEESPIVLDPLPTYKPLTDAFSVPLEIIRSPDTEGVLLKLRQIASPTANYHADLLNLAASAQSLDVAHLKVLVDACYYTAQDLARIQAELQTLKDANDYRSRARKASLTRDRQLALVFGVTSDQIINTGLSRLADYTFDEGLEILSRLFPRGSNRPVFGSVIAKFQPLSGDQRLRLMDVATEKAEHFTAAVMAIGWFRDWSDRGYRTLLTLAGRLKEQGKDYLLLEAVKLLSNLSLDQVVELAHAAYQQEGEVAAIAYGKTGQYSHANVLWIAGQLSEQGKGPFFMGALDYYEALSTRELLELMDLAKSDQSEIALKAVNKVSDLTPARAVEVSSRLRGSDKDDWLKAALKRFDQLTTNELLSMMKASYVAETDLAMQALSKISDFGHANMLKVAGQLKANDKDDWLEKALTSRIGKLTTDELIELMRASYVQEAELATRALDKLSDLSVANAVKVAKELQSNDKDDWLRLVLRTKITTLSTDELITAMQASYVCQDSLALEAINKLSDLNPENVVRVAGELESNEKDDWIKASLKKLDKLTTAQLIKIMNASYVSADTFAIDSMGKVTDLTSGNALLIVAELQSNEKDDWLLKFLTQKVTTLTTAELISYMKASYVSEADLAMKALEKISDLSPANAVLVAEELESNDKDSWLLSAFARFQSVKSSEIKAAMKAAYVEEDQLAMRLVGKASDLTVQNAITLADLLQSNSKDDLLLKMVDLVTDLTRTNLENLVSHAYIAQEEVRAKGLKRLSR